MLRDFHSYLVELLLAVVKTLSQMKFFIDYHLSGGEHSQEEWQRIGHKE